MKNQKTLEHKILENLLKDQDYARKVIAYLKPAHFSDHEAIVFQEIEQHYSKYNKPITLDILTINLSERQSITDEQEKECLGIVDRFDLANKNEQEWILDKTEEFVQEQEIIAAILKSTDILENKDKTLKKNALPGLFKEALSVSFDADIGHNYFDDVLDRYEFYHSKEILIPTALELFDLSLGGGFPQKTLNVLLAGTNVGKTLIKCCFAANMIKQGYDVLYITLEMAEERIAERIDANLFNLPVNMVKDMTEKEFSKRINDLKKKSYGQLFIKEYPPATVHPGHFKSLLNDLALKKDFHPDVIFVDYMNLSLSERFRTGGSHNSYTILKSVAEELRGIAVEYKVPLITSTQTNRSGAANTDPSMTDTAEAFSIPMTADWMGVAVRTEELDALNQIMIKKLKTRYNDVSYYRKFVMGIDTAKFKLYDLEDSAQEDIDDSGISQDDKPINNIGIDWEI